VFLMGIQGHSYRCVVMVGFIGNGTLIDEKYFEKVLRLAIYKQGTDEGALIRVVTTRAEVDMKFIRKRFWIKHLTSSIPTETRFLVTYAT
jgi:hypothetical protein